MRRTLAFAGISWLFVCTHGLVGCAPSHPSEVPAKAPEAAARPGTHPLVHGLYAREGGVRVDEARAFEKLATHAFVLVGEKHDNDEHHAFEARLVEALGKLATLGAKKPRPVVFEHLGESKQGALDTFFAKPNVQASMLPAEVGWEERGWGPFAAFEPIFAAALRHRMPLVAGNFDKLDVRALKASPDGVFSPEVRAELSRVTFDDAQEKALVDELYASHCGHLPGDFLAPMALAQHARDARFALAMRSRGDSSVLVAGKGHTRGDRGVPRFLPLGSFASVAMVEVDDAKTQPSAYEELATHDYVYFTPRRDDEDPCAAFHPKAAAPHEKK